MALLDYSRHFVLLVGATAALALVLALRSSASWLSRAGFVVAAAAVSVAAAPAGVGLAGLLYLNLTLTVLLALAFTSAFGAAWYWLLVRRFWAPFLSRASLLVTIGVCVLATFIAPLMSGAAMGAAGRIPRDPFISLSWWIGFSISLYVTDRRRPASGPEG